MPPNTMQLSKTCTSRDFRDSTAPALFWRIMAHCKRHFLQSREITHRPREATKYSTPAKSLNPGGISDCSRWLSDSDTTGTKRPKIFRTLKGVLVQLKHRCRISRGNAWGVHDAHGWHSCRSAIRFWFRVRWYRCAQPPATGLDASGIPYVRTKRRALTCKSARA